MAAIKLTEGAIAALSSGDPAQSDIKPLLQVADIRPVSTQNQGPERYRLLLSDGDFTQQGMLATQRNELVKSERLQKGSIVQLLQFVCNDIQNRKIIIIIDLDVILEKCDLIGMPKQYQGNNDVNAPSVTKPSVQGQPMNQRAVSGGNPPYYGGGYASRPVMVGGAQVQSSGENYNGGSYSYGNSFSGNMNSGRYNPSNAMPVYPKPEINAGPPPASVNNSPRPPNALYQEPSPNYNRGPIAKNEAPPRIIPIAALNPYQGRWTIKARVTAKGELRHYNNPRGDGKVFSFDLLDSEGGEIRVTGFNAVADQFYHQIEPGKIYMISRGMLKPAQKAFNHLRNDHEIMLDNSSTVQPCYEDDRSIPQQQFHFRPISDIEGLENNSVLDLIAIVSSINPPGTIMRKNGTETQKRTLQLKDMSGRSVELTLWGNFCNAEGQTLQTLCDSGNFPVLALKSGRVNDFNGKSVGTISSSQLFIEPDFPEAQKLKAWFNSNGKNTPTISLSRDAGTTRTDVRKTISQIKDEKLGTSEKPDWITVSATLTFIKVDNFCYNACPLMIGDRQCNKKVTNNGDGKWQCDRCDRLVDECDYRYILQMQIQDHTGLTWVTAFQESGEEIIGKSAKEMYLLKYEEQDEDKFSELVRDVLFTKFIFKLKVKEETFSDEQRVKSTVVRAEKVNFQTETKYLLDLVAKSNEDNWSSVPPVPHVPTLPPKRDVTPTAGGYGGSIQPSSTVMNYTSNAASASVGSYGNQYGGSGFPSTGTYTSCGSCGGSGHNSANCPSLTTGPGQSYDYKSSSGGNGECYKCHQAGHWAKDCPGVNNAPPAYGSNNTNPRGSSGECYKCHQVGHWAKDCPGVSNAPPAHGTNAYGSNNMNPSGSFGECYKCHQVGHWAKDCPGVSNAYGANAGRYGTPQKQYVGGF